MSKKKRVPAETRTGDSRKKIARRSVFLSWFIVAAMLLIFGGRWLYAITEGYFGAFVQTDSSLSSAMNNMGGLTLSEEEAAVLLPLQKEWDLFTSSRLRDEVTCTAKDGTQLHGYLYDADSNMTVVVLPRFGQDGTADFLPGVWLYEKTGCNLLMPDPRTLGGSGGDYFGFGYLEQHDLAAWLSWADEALGAQTFILWGEGTGANTILFAQASGLLPDSVAFAVTESPYASLHTLASRQIFHWYTVPAIPFLSAIEWKVSHTDTGFQVDDLELGDALSAAESNLPVLFLESALDDYVLPEWSRTVYDLYPGKKQRISGGGNHGTVYAYCQEDIQALLDEKYFERDVIGKERAN